MGTFRPKVSVSTRKVVRRLLCKGPYLKPYFTCMQSIISLLTTALLLLQLVHNSPNLPQSVKDSANGIANQAISEATSALKAQNFGSTETTLQAVVTPVVPTPAPIVLIQTVKPEAPVITIGTIITDKTIATINWDTSEATHSDILLGGKPTDSESGFSAHHVVHFSEIQPGTHYDFTIEATNNDLKSTVNGSFTTLGGRKMVFSNLPSGSVNETVGSNIPIRIILYNDQGIISTSYPITVTTNLPGSTPTILNEQTGFLYNFPSNTAGEYRVDFNQPDLGLTLTAIVTLK